MTSIEGSGIGVRVFYAAWSLVALRHEGLYKSFTCALSKPHLLPAIKIRLRHDPHDGPRSDTFTQGLAYVVFEAHHGDFGGKKYKFCA